MLHRLGPRLHADLETVGPGPLVASRRARESVGRPDSARLQRVSMRVRLCGRDFEIIRVRLCSISNLEDEEPGDDGVEWNRTTDASAVLGILVVACRLLNLAGSKFSRLSLG